MTSDRRAANLAATLDLSREWRQTVDSYRRRNNTRVQRTIDQYRQPAEPVTHGWEVTYRPSRTRMALSPAGQRRHARLETLMGRGWAVLSMQGVGTVLHADKPGFWSIAAAAIEEGLK